MQNQTLNGPDCLSALRRIGLNIMRLIDDDHSLKRQMGTAAMNDKYLPNLLANAVSRFKE